MSNDKLFIPDKIKVGYQERSDTYTKRLAYVIYYDQKGVLRKEAGWRGWIHDQDVYQRQYLGDGKYSEKEVLVRKGIPTDDFENTPTEGFVLNKKVGGYRSDWNHRSTYCRVFDPRGFEFEITVDNLTFILEEANCYKGKGLEGKFVYAWAGKDLVLLPCSSLDYEESRKYTDLQSKKVKAKELKPGFTYTTKKKLDVTYLGRFNWCKFNYNDKVEVEQMFVFIDDKNKPVAFKKADVIAELKTDVEVDNFAALMDIFINSENNGNIKGLSLEASKIKFGQEEYYGNYCKDGSGYNTQQCVVKQDVDNEYKVYHVIAHYKKVKEQAWSYYDNYKFSHYTLQQTHVVNIVNGEFILKEKSNTLSTIFDNKQAIVDAGYHLPRVLLHSGKTRVVNF